MYTIHIRGIEVTCTTIEELDGLINRWAVPQPQPQPQPMPIQMRALQRQLEYNEICKLAEGIVFGLGIPQVTELDAAWQAIPSKRRAEIMTYWIERTEAKIREALRSEPSEPKRNEPKPSTTFEPEVTKLPEVPCRFMLASDAFLDGPDLTRFLKIGGVIVNHGKLIVRGDLTTTSYRFFEGNGAIDITGEWKIRSETPHDAPEES